MKKTFLTLLLFLIPSILFATQPATNVDTGVRFSACTPSDPNSNCGGGGSGTNYWLLGSGNVGISTTNNVGIGSVNPQGSLDVGSSGTICLGGVCDSTWPSGTSQWTGTAGNPIYYGHNVGIGTSTASQQLVIGSTGQATVDSTGNFVTSGTYASSNAGSASSPTFQLSSGNGWYLNTTNEPSLSVAGSLQAYFDTTGAAFGLNSQNDAEVAVGHNQNAVTEVRVFNNNASGAAASDFYAANGTKSFQIGIHGTGFTTNGGLIQGDSYSYTSTPGYDIIVDGAGNHIKFYQPLATLAMDITGGNVGIGSLSPGQLLDVAGSIRITQFNMPTGKNNNYVLTSDANGNGTWQAAGGASNYWLNDSGNVGLNTTYNVGIGTISQLSTLVVNGNQSIGTFGTTAAPTNGLIVSGNVGIGSLTPGQALDVNGTVRATSFTGAGTNLTGTAASLTSGAVTTISGQVTNSSPITLSGSGTSGSPYNVGINTTGTWNGNAVTASNGINTFTTTGSSGAATYSAGVLNIPQYSGGGSSQWTYTSSGNIGLGTISTVGIGTTGGVGGLIVMNGNVGIGTWVPKGTLDVGSTGTICLGGTCDSTWPSGGGSSNWTYSSSGNIGLSTTAAVGIGTTFVGGSGEAALSVMNGNVGIGTWVPSKLFQVGGQASSASNGLTIDSGGGIVFTGTLTYNNNGGLSITNNSSNASGTTLAGSGATNSPLILASTTSASATTDNIIFKMRNSFTAMIVQDNSGAANVGIGSASPNAALDVEGTLYPTVFYGSGTDYNVGIGSYHPGQALDVQGTIRSFGYTTNSSVCKSAAIGQDTCFGTGVGGACLGYCTAGTFPACSSCTCC